MTSVTYEYEAELRDGDVWRPLHVTSIVPSVDMDRVPYTAATLTVGGLSEREWGLLDPRTVDPAEGGQVRWRMRQLDLEGRVLAYLPRLSGSADEWATMFVRTVSRSLDVATVAVAGGETMIDDREVIEETRFFVGGHEISRQIVAARDVGELVDIVLGLTFGSGAARAADATADAALSVKTFSTLLDAGYEVDPAQGTSFLQLVENQLSATGCRLLDAWGIEWLVADRDRMPAAHGAPSVHRWASYDEDLPDGVEPVIVGFSERVSRDGDWADTVAVEGEADSFTLWQHYAAGGTRSRGRVISISGAEPSANLAESIASRTFRRGHDITIIARTILDVTPGARLEVYSRSGILTADIVSVEWRTEDGEMTVHARSAEAMAIDAADTVNARRISAEDAVSEARTLAVASYDAAVAKIPDSADALQRLVREVRWMR